MRRIRLFALGIVSFFAVLMSALLAPGTFVNRALSTALCAVFSFNSTICTVNLANSSDRVVAATPPAVERNIGDWLVRDPGEFDDAPSVPSGSNPQVPPFPQDPGPNVPVRPDFDNRELNQPTQPQRGSCSLTGTWIYSLYVEPVDNALVYRLPLQINQEGSQVSMAKSRSGSFQSRKNISNLMRVGNGQSITETLGNLTAKTIVDVDGATQWGEIREHTSGESIYFVMERQTPCIPSSQFSYLGAINLTQTNKVIKTYVSPFPLALRKQYSELSSTQPEIKNQILPINSSDKAVSQLGGVINVKGLWLLERPEFMLQVSGEQKGCYPTNRAGGVGQKKLIALGQVDENIYVSDSIGKIKRPNGSLVVQTMGMGGTVKGNTFTLSELSGMIPNVGKSRLQYQGTISADQRGDAYQINGTVICNLVLWEKTAKGNFSMTRQKKDDDEKTGGGQKSALPNQQTDSVVQPIENKPWPSFQTAFQNFATQNNPPSELVKLADAARDFATNNPDAITFVSNAAMLMTIIGGAGLALHSLVAGAGLTGAGTAAIETTATTATATEAGTAFNAANAFSKLGKFAPEIYKTLQNVL